MTRKLIPNSQSAICNPQSAIRSGSAIILAIVLTTLLAMIGVLFLLSSRVDSVATSAVGDNEDLKLAVDTVVAQISQNLTTDVARGAIDPNQYADYPDPCNSWLACLEPYQSGLDYFWRQVSDMYGNIYPVSQIVQAQVLPDYNNMFVPYTQADADGDGVSDSIWVEMPGKMSAKGKPIYAAIRIIDNGGMLNINTGFKFDPNYSVGSTQLDINLMALSWRPNNPFFPYNPIAENILLQARNPSGLANYEPNVIWQYGIPNGAYTPFDISDELELRYRFLVNQQDIDTRAEVLLGWELRTTSNFRSPVDSGQLNKWFINASPDTVFDVNYAYRHIATTYNLDRIINPNGQKMFNINSPLTFDVNSIYNTIRAALVPNIPNSTISLITANLIDYVDGPNYPATDLRYDPNNEVKVVYDDVNIPHYGFEQPCIYLSEIAQNFYQPDPNVPEVNSSYAIELFKPYWQDNDQNGWRVVTTDSGNAPHYAYITWTGSRRFHVLTNIDPQANISIDLNEFPGPNEAGIPDPCHLPQAADVNFGNNTTILLQRDVNGFGAWVTVDWIALPPAGSGWMEPNTISVTHSYERDIASIHRCIRKVLSPTMTTTPTIGFMNSYDSGSEMIQAHPANKPFTNIGEIGQLFRTDAYLTNESSTEAEVRLNIADPNVQNIFKYLTVIDPAPYTGNPNETRIKGRININTAPWFVIAQLPWVTNGTPSYELAQAIVAYRDKFNLVNGVVDYSLGRGRGMVDPCGVFTQAIVREEPGFASIGELMNVTNNLAKPAFYDSRYDIRKYATGNAIPPVLMTPPDGAGDIFEERDVIFDRISNLITVRSDVFTAYILVRIGQNGPQKRVIAILDRSNVTPTSGKVKIVAIQPVPEPGRLVN